MSDQIRDIWKKFDEVAEKADETDSNRVIVEAIRLQTELINLRLAGLPHEIAAILSRNRPLI
jgi:hypothetical protein